MRRNGDSGKVKTLCDSKNKCVHWQREKRKGNTDKPGAPGKRKAARAEGRRRTAEQQPQPPQACSRRSSGTPSKDFRTGLKTGTGFFCCSLPEHLALRAELFSPIFTPSHPLLREAGAHIGFSQGLSPILALPRLILCQERLARTSSQHTRLELSLPSSPPRKSGLWLPCPRLTLGRGWGTACGGRGQGRACISDQRAVPRVRGVKPEGMANSPAVPGLARPSPEAPPGGPVGADPTAWQPARPRGRLTRPPPHHLRGLPLPLPALLSPQPTVSPTPTRRQRA